MAAYFVSIVPITTMTPTFLKRAGHMRKRLSGQLWILFVLLSTLGCRTRQLRNDQDEFRVALLSMETNQIMDNLVRARLGLPIVHVDYDKISGTVTQSAIGEVRGSYMDVVGGAITRTISAALTPKQENQLTVTGNPVRDKPEVYLAYLQFLALPDSLVVSPEPPPPCAAHLWKCCNGTYYWVPVDRRGEFFQLAMRVSALRGQAPPAPEGFEISIVQVLDIAPPLGQGETPTPGTSFKLQVEFDKSVPNDAGSANISLGGIVYPVQFMLDDRVEHGKSTKSLFLIYVFGNQVAEGQIPIVPATLAGQLRNQRIKYFSARFRPPAPTADRLLRDIGEELNLIRLNQLRVQQP